MSSSLFQILSWLILIFLLGFGLYVALIIKNEKKVFREFNQKLPFFDIALAVPTWWTLTERSDQKLHFERTDTRYDWRAEFEQYPESNGDIEKLASRYLDEKKIVLDPDLTKSTLPSHLFFDKKTLSQVESAIRFEGTGTEDEEHRLYMDLYFVKFKNMPGVFRFESKSSVLNGCLEGPFFEDVVSYLKLSETSPASN